MSLSKVGTALEALVSENSGGCFRLWMSSGTKWSLGRERMCVTAGGVDCSECSAESLLAVSQVGSRHLLRL